MALVYRQTLSTAVYVYSYDRNFLMLDLHHLLPLD